AALAAVHTVNDLSAPPAATLAPLALKATAVTARVLPGKALSICWLARFQRRACLSVHPVSSLVPSGLRATLVTSSGWTSALGPAIGNCQTFTLPSSAVETTWLLLGWKESEVIGAA